MSLTHIAFKSSYWLQLSYVVPSIFVGGIGILSVLQMAKKPAKIQEFYLHEKNRINAKG